ncbi:hypothetical protein [Actinopolymorpha rutila]|uniref:Uncharacterized protein n=1 Tax=Actinopolymorpha rutila TaxID=446787 RepID=A0A852ZLK3_9ACTN|nr:hypothetical protein [Actinopolymorpha rutila]NYH93005.1 hypothetical protein [Actinopolymorpha rutila]
MAEGTLIAESLRTDAELDGLDGLDGLDLIVHRIVRAAVGDPAAGQPVVWTLLSFSVPDDRAPALAERFARALDSGSWYVDFRTNEETFVVYAGRVFRHPRGDREGETAARAYGRSVGVPESQLDWPT